MTSASKLVVKLDYSELSYEDLKEKEKEVFNKIDEAKQEWYKLRFYLFKKKQERLKK